MRADSGVIGGVLTPDGTGNGSTAGLGVSPRQQGHSVLSNNFLLQRIFLLAFYFRHFACFLATSPLQLSTIDGGLI